MGDRRAVRLEWSGERLRFRGGGTDPVSAEIVLDADNEEGPSPMLALLLAAAGCTGADVVSILKKMRVDLRALSVEVDGARRDEHPKRYTAITYRFRIEGEGLDRAKAERAVELSLERYCSVAHSLAPDIVITHEIELV